MAPTKIQTALAAKDAAIHNLIAVDRKIEEASANIASLEDESNSAIQLTQTLEGQATIMRLLAQPLA